MVELLFSQIVSVVDIDSISSASYNINGVYLVYVVCCELVNMTAIRDIGV